MGEAANITTSEQYFQSGGPPIPRSENCQHCVDDRLRFMSFSICYPHRPVTMNECETSDENGGSQSSMTRAGADSIHG
jgi:hypothetical protein